MGNNRISMVRSLPESPSSSSMDLTCDRAMLYIASYLDGVLGPARRRDLGEHLAVCRRCRRLLASFEVPKRATAPRGAGARA